VRILPVVFRREWQRRERQRQRGVGAGDGTVREDTGVHGGVGGASTSGVAGGEVPASAVARGGAALDGEQQDGNKPFLCSARLFHLPLHKHQILQS
jgi:hypothetical protein